MSLNFENLTPAQILIGLDRSPSKWDERSRQLWRASEILQAAASAAHDELFPMAMQRQDEHAQLVASGLSVEEAKAQTSGTLDRERELQLTSEVTMQGAMLRAFSIECLLKAIYYEREIKLKGHVKDCEEVNQTHNLVFLAGKLEIKLTDEQKSRCESLQELVILGRYPTLKKHEKDKKTKQKVLKRWHANAESNPPDDLKLREYIQSQRITTA